jgi:hypothetical protein
MEGFATQEPNIPLAGKRKVQLRGLTTGGALKVPLEQVSNNDPLTS